MSDWIEVKSTLLALSNKIYSCSHCLSKYSGRNDGEMMTEKERSVKNCRTIGENAFVNIDKQIFYRTCPGNFYSPSVISLLEAHESYRNGNLPFSGSHMDQPNKVMELFRQFDSHYAAEAEKARKAAAMKPKGGARRG